MCPEPRPRASAGPRGGRSVSAGAAWGPMRIRAAAWGPIRVRGVVRAYCTATNAVVSSSAPAPAMTHATRVRRSPPATTTEASSSAPPSGTQA